jgi:hypothetical protein
MLSGKRAMNPPLGLATLAALYRASVRNLAYYLAPRHSDRRPLQERLDHIGASSLGHAKSNVLANVDKALVIVRQLTGDGREP